MDDKYPGATKRLFLSCPICGLQRPLKKDGSEATMRGKPLDKGVKGLQHFNRVDVTKHDVVRECACLGYGKGFPKTNGMTLKEIGQDPAFSWIKAELVAQCRAILAELGESEGSG